MTATHETPEPRLPVRALILNSADMAAMFADMDRLRTGDCAKIWHGFPTTAAALSAALAEIGADAGKPGSYFINDYATEIPGLYERLPVGAGLDEINYLAALLSKMPEDGRDAFSAAMLAGRHCGSVMKMANAAEHVDLFELQPAFTPAQYGEFLALTGRDEAAGAIARLSQSQDPDLRALAGYIGRLEQYFDMDAYARDIVREENGVFTDLGYLTERGDLGEAHAKTVPEAYRVTARPAPAERPSAMERLAAAKEAAGRAVAERPAAPPKAREPER